MGLGCSKKNCWNSNKVNGKHWNFVFDFDFDFDAANSNGETEQKKWTETNEPTNEGTVKIEWKTVSNFLSSFWQVEIFSSS